MVREVIRRRFQSRLYTACWAATKFVGLRDRLRCPKCSAIGTWKPHGSYWFDREDKRGVSRWMCKWCGYYIGPEGEQQALADPAVNAWQLEKDAGPGSDTPQRIVARSESRAWPWRG